MEINSHWDRVSDPTHANLLPEILLLVLLLLLRWIHIHQQLLKKFPTNPTSGTKSSTNSEHLLEWTCYTSSSHFWKKKNVTCSVETNKLEAESHWQVWILEKLRGIYWTSQAPLLTEVIVFTVLCLDKQSEGCFFCYFNSYYFIFVWKVFTSFHFHIKTAQPWCTLPSASR